MKKKNEMENKPFRSQISNRYRLLKRYVDHDQKHSFLFGILESITLVDKHFLLLTGVTNRPNVATYQQLIYFHDHALLILILITTLVGNFILSQNFKPTPIAAKRK